MQSLEDQFLELLKKDEKFRLAVASYLGYEEILRRLREHDEKFNSILEEIKLLRDDVKKLWENQNKMWEELRSLREDQKKLWQEVRALRENQDKLWQEVKALREEQGKIWEELRRLREDQGKIWQEIRALREDQSKIWGELTKVWEELKSLKEGQDVLRKEIGALREEQVRMATTLERLTISVEEEARDMISWRLEKELGLKVQLSRVFVDDVEVNIYGCSGDVCVVGEATVRLGVRLVEELEDKVELIKERMPDMLKGRLIKVIYTDYAVPQALKLAEEKRIWVLNWRGDLTRREIIELKQ